MIRAILVERNLHLRLKELAFVRQCELHVLDVESAFYPHALVVGLYAENLVGLCVEAFGMIEVFRAEEQRQIVALLHDTLEDTDATEEDLRIFGEDVVHAVKLLTRAKRAGEEEYVKNVLSDPMAAVVKNADKISNLYDSAFSGIVGQVRSEKAKKFAKKYVEKARKYYAHKFSPALDDAIEKVDALLEDEYVRDWQTPNYTREEMRI